ncbi:UvrD-helicase domain-containing protein [Aestuariimicrobium sp. T2.26MG-19.2B]|uniref:UvrD-helicase domain-containing protein n=1 Tax=Aestuariimicrobium sp. T2.26MG-19.2B TaxID=3040679 RepID=UPI00247775B1|nr:UvrD-helicase domain-containing protein [Aestuariimicrobium sp. T2.26MG-19.2B]CAI9407101.1 ATP-dependent DNA helicase UvrD1 [Aestuariimicrobium sp. T2.26MG-19.2B]
MSDQLPDLFSFLDTEPGPAERAPLPTFVDDSVEPPSKPRGSRGPKPEELLDGLNTPQREAVLHEGSPVLVVAGAGSGKTRVLTRRIAWLVSQRDVHPGSILAITFTNKAAAEMRARVVDLVGGRAKLMWVSTFHSACVRILRAEIDKFGYKRTFSIYDDTDSKRLMSLVLRDLDLDPKKYPVRSVMNWVSNRKNDLVDFERAIRDFGGSNEQVFAEIYGEYQRRLKAAEALDFDDLIMTTVHLFQAFPEVREQYRRRFRHVLVDEYQDTNQAQYQLIRQLCGVLSDDEMAGFDAVATEPAELMVVGDSDQSIYAFRGATIRNILDFDSDFPGARTILLEQNYRSTQNVLTAANAVIRNNSGRPDKQLWSQAGEGDLVVGYVADTEHDEANFIANEIDALSDAGTTRYGDTAIFYRTNAQSRAFEEVFIRTGIPYRIVGGVRFYERREIRDAIAYLRAIANPADDVSVRRILNVPKRGIGDKAEQAVEALAVSERIPFGQALDRVDEITELATRSRTQLREFAAMMARHRAMVDQRVPANEILTSILKESGYLQELEHSSDPQDQTRLENLVELVAVAQEFVVKVNALDITDLDEDDLDALDEGEQITGLAAGMPEADDSLAAFLERTALVADSDSIPDDGSGAGVVTLMTLHTAKGLEFDTVFLTGLEDGIFPHMRALVDPSELAEERRLAYVGITRARKRLYLSRAAVRTAWGAPAYNPPSRFLDEIPAHLLDWRRTGAALTSWAAQSATRTRQARQATSWSGTSGSSGGVSFGNGRGVLPASAKPKAELVVKPGDRVLHTVFGMGTVVATSGSGDQARADVNFGSGGVKRFMLKHAPMEKL